MAGDHPVTILRRKVYANGFQPVAVVTNKKNPISKSWQTFKGVPFLSHAALNTGINCNTLRAIDIDIDDADMVRTVVALTLEILGDTPLIRFRSDSARRLLVYRGVGKKKVVGKKKDPKNYYWKVEVLSEGNQFVAFGGHPDGAQLEWEGESPETFKFADLPEVDDEKIDRLRQAIVDALDADPLAEDWAPTPVERPVDTSTLTPRLRAYMDVALAGERARVANCAEGNRNVELNNATMKLAQLVAAGLIDQATIQHEMEAAAVECGLWAHDKPRQCRATIASGMRKGLSEPRRIEDIEAEIGPEIIIHKSFYEMKESVEAVRAEVAAAAPVVPAMLGDGVDWTKPGGLIGEIAAWIVSTSPLPNIPFAVAAATSALSVVCGRWLYGPTNSAVNLYVAMLGQTGCGKDRPLSAPGELLRACGLERLAKSGKAFSVSGLEQIIVDTPCCLATVDEMGTNLLARIMHKRASSQETAMKGTLQELWSRVRGKEPFMTTARASSASIEVNDPALTLFGASTPDQFYENLKNNDVLNGFMNRFLIAPSGPRSDEDEDVTPTPCPASIVARIKQLKPSPKGNIQADPYGNIGKVDPTTIPWASDDAKQTARAWRKTTNELIAIPKKGELWGRAYEYTIRLATLNAISNGALSVDTDDLEWGAAWVRKSVEAMIEAAENIMSRSEYETKLNDVKDAIRKAGTVSRSELLRSLRHIDVRDLTRIGEHLAEAAMVLINGVNAEGVAAVKTGKTGRPPTFYHWIG